MGNDDNVDEYANARKMVQRASDREALLKSSNNMSMSDDEQDDERAQIDRAVFADFSDLPLRRDHINRPCWVCPDGIIYLEAFHELYSSAYDFLVAISEPVARPEYIHQYRLTPYSLYAAVATNIHTESIIKVLSRLSKNEVPSKVIDFIQECTKRYGKAKLCLKFNKYFVESEHSNVLRELLRDKLISQARVADTDESGAKDSEGFVVSASAMEMDTNLDILRREPGEESDDDDSEGGIGDDGAQSLNKQALTTVAFQVKAEQVENVKKRAIELDYPLMEEYDFRNDKTNSDIPMDLKPNTRIRRYQERSLAKMFGNGRARSGIIVLPCGAGKTLTGVTAAQTIKKSCVCLCTNAVSVLQWKYQFKLWTNIPDDRISCFTSDKKDPIHPDGCVLITTYTMVSYGGKRSDTSEAVMKVIRGREWGFLLMDEVHVVPAKMFRRVIGSVKAHCRLGLTATLVREDDLISGNCFLLAFEVLLVFLSRTMV